MSAMYLRGGIPRLMKGTAHTTQWDRHEVPDGVCNSLVFKNSGGNPIMIALSKEDADLGVGYTVANGTTIGPWPAETGAIWTKSTGGDSAWEALAFVRRG